MSIEPAVLALSGTVILLSLILTQLVSPYFAWLTALAGAGLLSFAFFGFCPAAMVFRAIGLKSERPER